MIVVAHIPLWKYCYNFLYCGYSYFSLSLNFMLCNYLYLHVQTDPTVLKGSFTQKAILNCLQSLDPDPYDFLSYAKTKTKWDVSQNGSVSLHPLSLHPFFYTRRECRLTRSFCRTSHVVSHGSHTGLRAWTNDITLFLSRLCL